MGWNVVAEELGEFVEVLPPQKRVSENWYLGTADAVYQNLYSHRSARTQSTSWCCRVTTSTRWTTGRCCARTARAALR